MESNDSPEIQEGGGGGEISDITGLPLGDTHRKKSLWIPITVLLLPMLLATVNSGVLTTAL